MPGLKSLISALTSVLIPPSRLIRRLKPTRPQVPSSAPTTFTSDSGPFAWIPSSIASASSPSASSQEIRSQRPSPRSPVRRSGCATRSSPSRVWLQQAPFWQPIGFASGTPRSIAGMSPDGSSRTTFPSRM
jgi:hypothetical protein